MCLEIKHSIYPKLIFDLGEAVFRIQGQKTGNKSTELVYKRTIPASKSIHPSIHPEYLYYNILPRSQNLTPVSLMLKQINGERMREKPEGDFSVSSEDFK